MILNFGSTLAGGTLIVTAPAGVTVSASKDSVTKTITADANGVATFKGLTTGMWMVAITDGTQNTSRIVEIVTDYSTTVKFFATISVAYPEGSVCTCSDGITTLVAADTTGRYTFTIPNAGTWTLTSDSGTFTKSETIDITTEGQNGSVEIIYRWYLYNTGDTCDDLTGGWVANTNNSTNAPSTRQPSINYGDTGMHISLYNTSQAGYIAGTVMTNSMIDLKPYSKLCFDVSDKFGSTGVVVGAVKTMDATYSFVKSETINSTGICELDISDLTEEHTIAIELVTAQSTINIAFNSIYLE